MVNDSRMACRTERLRGPLGLLALLSYDHHSVEGQVRGNGGWLVEGTSNYEAVYTKVDPSL